MDVLPVVLLCLLLLTCLYMNHVEAAPRKVSGVRFLVTVNDTWADPPGCIHTEATSMIRPNKSMHIKVGQCDHGPINYTIISPGKDNNTYTLSLMFGSSVIEDAGPPTCDISWNGTYINPVSWKDSNPLPSCFTQDSREGWYLTYYWFRLLEWTFD